MSRKCKRCKKPHSLHTIIVNGRWIDNKSSNLGGYWEKKEILACPSCMAEFLSSLKPPEQAYNFRRFMEGK